MEFFTLNRQYEEQDIIDGFLSGIWTERYYGDGEVELIVPLTQDMIQKLPEGIFLGLRGSEEIMITETSEMDEEKGTLKLSGISLLPWTNNRFIRASATPEDRYWNPGSQSPGAFLWQILNNWCVDSVYLNGTTSMGVPNPERFRISEIFLISSYEEGGAISLGVPYGPVYDAMKAIAATYKIGMKLIFDKTEAPSRCLGFISYMGEDRTSAQNVNQPVQFSAEMGTLSKIKEIHSLKDYKNLAYSFAPGNPDGLAMFPGSASSPGDATGFDLRALLTFEEDITTDQVGGNAGVLADILNERARNALREHEYIKTVDGEIVPTFMYKYGVDYGMGDVIEVEGKSGYIQRSRVTEYIRAQQASGETAYPSVEMLE